MTDSKEAVKRLTELGETLSVTFCEGLDRKQILDLVRRRQEAFDKGDHSALTTLGLDDPEVISRLRELGVSEDGMAALTLTPLVAVAWADGKVDTRERNAVLAAAREQGLQPGDVAYLLLEGRLREQPSETLIESWVAYLEVLGEIVGPDALRRLRSRVFEQARRVASASGGFLGLGSRISGPEQEVLEELQRALG